MGIFRSIGALARALGPFVASASKFNYLSFVLLLFTVDVLFVVNVDRLLISCTLIVTVFWKSGSTFCYLAGALLLVFPLVYVINLRRRLRLTQHVNKAE